MFVTTIQILNFYCLNSLKIILLWRRSLASKTKEAEENEMDEYNEILFNVA